MTRDSPGRGNGLRKGEPEGRRCTGSVGAEGLWPGGGCPQRILRGGRKPAGHLMLTASWYARPPWEECLRGESLRAGGHRGGVGSSRTLEFVTWSLSSELPGTPITTILQNLKVFLDCELSSHLPPKPDCKLPEQRAVLPTSVWCQTPRLPQKTSAWGQESITVVAAGLGDGTQTTAGQVLRMLRNTCLVFSETDLSRGQENGFRLRAGAAVPRGTQPLAAALPVTGPRGRAVAGRHQGDTHVACAVLRSLEMELGSGERCTRPHPPTLPSSLCHLQ